LAQENVQTWSEEARTMVQSVHEWFNWKPTLNWHLLCHWHDVVAIHGPVRGYWAWVMERFNKQMKLLVYTTNFKNVHVRFSLGYSKVPIETNLLLWLKASRRIQI